MAWFFRHEKCSKRLSDLEDTLATQARQLKQLTQAIGDAEDYIAKLSGRVLKRLDRAQQAAPEGEQAQLPGTDPISAAIHARRNRVTNGGR